MPKREVDVVSTARRNDCWLVLYDLIALRIDAKAKGDVERVDSINSHINSLELKQEIKDRGIGRCAFSVTG